MSAPAPKVRFAPSPTGMIHIGNARTALMNALFARRAGGSFVLRFDDTDLERSREEYATAIAADLAWLGIMPDITVRQSQRFALYDAVAERLRAMGRLYPCYETPDELEFKRKRQLARGLPPVYDRAALALDDEERARLEAEGRKPHWRFRLEEKSVLWNDLVRGESRIDCASLSDPVLIRADGTYLYTLPSVADDADLGVTHIIRGEDHVTNTAVQIQLFEILGHEAPVFGHHNLLTTASGEGLSKRLGHLSLSALRENGYEPMAVAALAVLVGTSESVRPVADLDALAALLDFSGISRAPAKFDEHELEALNARIVHDLPYEEAAPRLEASGITAGRAFWEAVRGNIARLPEAAQWLDVVTGPVTPVIEDEAFCETAARLLPEGPLDAQSWSRWTGALKQETGRKGRALFMPLRLALTGRDHGPELGPLLPLIGRDAVLARLAGKSA